MAGWRMDPAPQQCAHTHFTPCAAVFGILDIPKKEFAKCFQQWQQCWAKCAAAEGNFVEDN